MQCICIDIQDGLSNLWTESNTKSKDKTQKTQSIAATGTWLTNSPACQSWVFQTFLPRTRSGNEELKLSSQRSQTRELLWLLREKTWCNWYECAIWPVTGSETIYLSKRHRQQMVTKSVSATLSGRPAKQNLSTKPCWLHVAQTETSHRYTVGMQRLLVDLTATTLFKILSLLLAWCLGLSVQIVLRRRTMSET